MVVLPHPVEMTANYIHHFAAKVQFAVIPYYLKIEQNYMLSE